MVRTVFDREPRRARTVLLLVCAWSMAVAGRSVADDGTNPNRATKEGRAPCLKDAVAGRFDIGVGVGLNALRVPENQALIVRHFNYITPENCMKFAAIQPLEGEFRFEKADQIVQFAQQNELKVLGHCLVWAKDDRTPEWFLQEGDHPVSPDVLMQRMKTHIRTVVERYRGRVQAWDVVNEAIGDRSDEYLRDSVWARLLNDDFIAEAFRLMHQLDPDALLIYNDYHLHQAWRRERMERIVKTLRRQGAHIDAIGIQGHYNLDAVPYAELEELLVVLRRLKLKIAISELDIDMIPRGVWWANGGKDREKLKHFDPYPDACPPELLARQAEQYGRLFDLFQEYEDVILRVTFWNLHDGESWLNHFPWTRVNYPLLFDRQRQPKPAFDAVIASLTRSPGGAAAEAGQRAGGPGSPEPHVPARPTQTRSSSSADAVLGSWAFALPDGHPVWLQVAREADGLEVQLLWSIGSARAAKNVTWSGGKLQFDRRVRWLPGGEPDQARQVTAPFEARRDGDQLVLTAIQKDLQRRQETLVLRGTRIPPLPPRPNLTRVRWGEPITLFNGRDLTGWRLVNPKKKNGWRVEQGVLINESPKTDFGGYGAYGNLRTEREFTDFQLDIDYNVGAGGNSGIYLRGMYEAQVVDRDGRMQGIAGPGAIFGRIAPTKNVGLPGGEWNHYRLTLCRRHITVELNGQTVIDNRPVTGCTGGGMQADDTKPGPIFLQGDHTSVKYRNIVLRPILAD